MSSTLDAKVYTPKHLIPFVVLAVEHTMMHLVPALMVRADNKADLERLTLDPSLPSELVKMVSVLSWEFDP